MYFGDKDVEEREKRRNFNFKLKSYSSLSGAERRGTRLFAFQTLFYAFSSLSPKKESVLFNVQGRGNLLSKGRMEIEAVFGN